MKKGKFITIEGTDGAGKSTFVHEIKAMLEARGFEVVLTREPGGTPLAEEIRALILDKKMDNMTALLLAFASRNEHIKNVINPALEAGKYVISDRFTDSTYAYQVAAQGIPREYVEVLEHMVQKQLKPDITLIFTVPVEVSRQRLNKTGKVPDNFESQNDDFFQNVLEGYLDIAKREHERCKIIDSSLSLEETKEQVIKVMNNFLLLNKSNKKLKQ
jgi:dTMP kinase